MSIGGSKTTEDTPTIPPELQSLLSQRTSIEANQVPALGQLLTSQATGGDPKTAPYTSAQLQPFQDAIARITQQIDRGPTSGGDADILKQRAARAVQGVEGVAQTSATKDVLDQLIALLSAPQYPVGQTTVAEHTPGIADYLNTTANVAKAAAAVA